MKNKHNDAGDNVKRISNSVYSVTDTTTREQLEQYEKEIGVSGLLPEGTWKATVVETKLLPDKNPANNMVAALLEVAITEEDALKMVRHKESFFITPRKSYSKVSQLTAFMRAIGLDDLSDNSLKKIKGKPVMIGVTHNQDGKNPQKTYTNIVSYAEVLDDVS